MPAFVFKRDTICPTHHFKNKKRGRNKVLKSNATSMAAYSPKKHQLK